MSVLLKKVLYYSVDSPEVPINLTDITKSSFARVLDIKNNVFVFDLMNARQSFDASGNGLNKYVSETYNITFQENDQLKIWVQYADDMADVELDAWSSTSVTEPDSVHLIGTYYIVEFTQKHNNQSTGIQVKCADKTYILFNKLWANVYPLVATSGTADGTTTSKLVNAGGKFKENANVGMIVYNVTDDTNTTITAIDDDDTLSLADDIFVSGEEYQLQWTSPSIIQKIIRSTTQVTSDSTGVEYDGTGSDSGLKLQIDARLEDSEGGYIQDFRKNTLESGAANTDLNFPGISIAKVWKPIYEWIKELSQIEYTNTSTEQEDNLVYGRPFKYYVDEDNMFHWFETDSVPSSTYTVGTTEGIRDLSIKKAVFDSVNFIVYRGGSDFYGNGTLGYKVANDATAKSLKMRVIPMTEIAKNLIDTELREGNLVANTNGAFTFKGNRYDRNGTINAVWNDVEYTSDSSYNTALRKEIKRKAGARAQAFLVGLAGARYKGTLKIKGSNVTVGSLITLNDYNIGINSENIRVMDVRHTLDKSGWFTTLGLEQDDEAIINLG